MWEKKEKLQARDLALCQGLGGSIWNSLKGLSRTLGPFLIIPMILYRFIIAWRERQNRHLLYGKVVMVTGASSGIGEALAGEFYRAGCKVILAARRENELERVRKSILTSHCTLPAFPPVVLSLDLSDLNTLASKVDVAKCIHGRIDILVNNGGTSFRGQVCDTELDVDIKVLLVNYLGQVALTKAVLPVMLSQGEGHIVMVSSIQGRIAIPQRSCYAASKHALQAFSDCLRAEVEERNVKVTVVNPGYVHTNLSLNALTAKGSCHGVMDETTAEGMSPEEVAREIVAAVVMRKREVTVATFLPKVAVWIRTLFPSLYFYIMRNRAARLREKEEGLEKTFTINGIPS
ncbi:unnamed protein product [Darwinula stevensoni]|uniref:Dehydrogenase/reductase SDR family protein 7-like n=1 Tax=Darwinula stevensoni TaxID=69355 RepID=A0A7R8XBS2_9CRUS|nr:unnamed protein product [Darwinula stevensoni]CAG0891297.1 unnamed protein product [Darwinula stevensoni]